jgi:hypothetical protein
MSEGKSKEVSDICALLSILKKFREQTETVEQKRHDARMMAKGYTKKIVLGNGKATCCWTKGGMFVVPDDEVN